MIDEASSEHFIYPYREHSSYSSVQFIKRAIEYSVYLPKIIQNDNGAEFTHIKKTNMIHPIDILVQELKIKHQLIRPRTPRHKLSMQHDY